jgi:tRNA-dihydrouridine synthase B
MGFQVGSWNFPHGVLLAPLQDITSDPIFRLLCRDQGAELAFVPMLDIREFCRAPEEFAPIFASAEVEKPFAVQLLGNARSPVKECLDLLTPFHVNIIDLNLGCAAHNELIQGMGGALLRKQGKAASFADEVLKFAACPVTAKMRASWSRQFNFGVKIARELEQCGVGALIVHGRSVKAKYAEKSNPKHIKAIRDAVDIPVVANGDIKNNQDAELLVAETGAAGVMVGRAAIGNPYIFRELTGNSSPPVNQLPKPFRPLWLVLDYWATAQRSGIIPEFSSAKHFLFLHVKNNDLKAKLHCEMEQVKTIEEFIEYACHECPSLGDHPFLIM